MTIRATNLLGMGLDGWDIIQENDEEYIVRLMFRDGDGNHHSPIIAVSKEEMVFETPRA